RRVERAARPGPAGRGHAILRGRGNQRRTDRHGGGRAGQRAAGGARAVARDSLMDRDRELLRHFLAALAYRTQKAVRGAPDHYAGFSAGNRVRTPAELLRHMSALMGYVRTYFVGGSYPMKPEPLPTFQEEIARFHELLEDRKSTRLNSSH